MQSEIQIPSWLLIVLLTTVLFSGIAIGWYLPIAQSAACDAKPMLFSPR